MGLIVVATDATLQATTAVEVNPIPQAVAATTTTTRIVESANESTGTCPPGLAAEHTHQPVVVDVLVEVHPELCLVLPGQPHIVRRTQAHRRTLQNANLEVIRREADLELSPYQHSSRIAIGDLATINIIITNPGIIHQAIDPTTTTRLLDRAAQQVADAITEVIVLRRMRAINIWVLLVVKCSYWSRRTVERIQIRIRIL